MAAALLLPLTLVALCVATSLAPSSTAGERDALIALYHSTGGENWRVNTNWLSDKPLYTWHGVAQRGLGGPVWVLDLANNGLSGPIPAALGELTRLESLNLRDNDLSGSIPGELADLRYLWQLDLGQNKLSGPIPAELADLRSLLAIYLDGNELSGPIPAELGDIGLLEVALVQNQLSGCIPRALREVQRSDFAWLGLPFCGETGPPVPVAPNSDRAVLVALYEATGGPSWERSENWLTDLPVVWWDGVTTDSAGRVTALHLQYNSLRGWIPAELGSLTSLEYLSLHSNMLSGSIPAELGSLSSLKLLALGNNRLRGPIPAALGGLSNLERLELLDNALSGSIPKELSRLQNLRFLWLSRNDFSGCVPEGLRDGPVNDISLRLPDCN